MEPLSKNQVFKTATEWAEHYKNNFYVFAKGCLDFHLLEKNPHLDFCKDIQRAYEHEGPNENLWLVPRGTFKTTIGVIALALWALVRNPDLTILLTTSKLSLSEERLLAIEALIESNAMIKQCFGNLRGYPWTQKSMRVSTRKDLSKKEDSITIGGVDSTNIGGHYDVIIYDDLVDDQNCKTEKGREDVKRYKRILSPLGKPGVTKWFGFGTPWHRSDMYDDIQRNQPSVSITRRSAYETYARINPNIQKDGLYFPNVMTEEYLEEQRGKLSLQEFACFYLCQPIDDSMKLLRMEWLRIINGEYRMRTRGIGEVSWHDPFLNKTITELVRPRLTVDPSLGKKDKDAIGLSLFGWGKDNIKYLIASWRVFGGMSYAAKKISWIVKTYGVFDIGVEVNGYGNFFRATFEQTMQDDGLTGYPVHKIVSRGDKETRIHSLMQDRCRRGELIVYNKTNDDFLYEYDRFPQCDHFDVIDATSMQWQLPGTRIPTEKDLQELKLEEPGYYDIHPSLREEWLDQQLGRLSSRLGRSEFTGY